MKVSVADAAGGNFHQRLSRTRAGNWNFPNHQWFAKFLHNRCSHGSFVGHRAFLPLAKFDDAIIEMPLGCRL
jgi:hypothetical protein